MALYRRLCIALPRFDRADHDVHRRVTVERRRLRKERIRRPTEKPERWKRNAERDLLTSSWLVTDYIQMTHSVQIMATDAATVR